MRNFLGLEQLCMSQFKATNPNELAKFLMADLENSQFLIYGRNSDEQPVTLAILRLLEDGMQYDGFDQRLDLVFAGQVITQSCPALTYCLQGKILSVTGRCSTIPKVCGVDLYLSRSYREQITEVVRQPFSISMNALFGIYRKMRLEN